MRMLSVEQRKSLESATTAYETQLKTTPAALSYLDGRGISSAVAEAYRLGFVAEPIGSEHETFAAMISIPYIKVTGVVGMKFRRLDDEKPRYLNTSGMGTHLYNTAALLRPSRIIGIAEGEPDTWTLDSLCSIPAVGIPGATQWRAHPEWARLLDGRQVLIFPDNDVGEKNPGEELAAAILGSIPTARIIRLPAPAPGEKKMDVNLCYLRYGADEIRKRAGL
jgi:DNA primase